MTRTVVFFHAHPDDEVITTGGTMAKLSDAGDRVVLVLATKGELGEVAEGYLDPDEPLWSRRVQEVHAAAEILGVHRVEFLGYLDSGMMGDATNDAEGSFWSADVDEAAVRLAAILTDEDADAITVYDDHGGYGHPDHIQVHRVGVAAAELAATPWVYESTADRDALKAGVLEARAAMGPDSPAALDLPPADFLETLGSPDALITTRIAVAEYTARKRAAMAAHASQINESSFFLAMPDDMFVRSFGTESYIRRGAPPGTREWELFARP